jgi:site-specific recombinase XerC
MRSPATEKGHHAGRSPANAGKTYPAEIFTPSEARALIAACSRRAPTGVRNRALIAVLYRAGLRVSAASYDRCESGEERDFAARCAHPAHANAGTLEFA